MDLPDLQRIPDVVRRTLGGIVTASAVDQLVDFVRETLSTIQHLGALASRVTTLEEHDADHARELTNTRSRLADLCGRLSKLEDQVSTHAREVGELRVRIHGATARITRVEEDTGLHIRELGEFRTRLDHVDDRIPHVDLADLEQHMAENERRIAAALAEIRTRLSAERQINSDSSDQENASYGE